MMDMHSEKMRKIVLMNNEVGFYVCEQQLGGVGA